jgi:hypothetical protein
MITPNMSKVLTLIYERTCMTDCTVALRQRRGRKERCESVEAQTRTVLASEAPHDVAGDQT